MSSYMVEPTDRTSLNDNLVRGELAATEEIFSSVSLSFLNHLGVSTKLR